jgi:membrane-bound lytic murein transglycosylase D
MMMKLIFFISTLFLFTVGTVYATSDTTTTISPAKVLTQPAPAVNDFKSILEHQAITTKMIRLNPRAKTFVHDYMKEYTKSMMKIKGWGLPYLNMIDEIFEEHGIPVELKYLAVVESKLKSGALSQVGAAGPWQFMPSTAKGYGLKITKTRDDRRDYVKSTHAAAKYLKYLYNEFGDWLLVIAAYNSGPGYVLNAIKKSGSRNFWDLQYFLPAESRNHVKRFIGTHYIFEGQGGICTLTRQEATEQIGSLAGYLLNRNLTAEELNEASTTTISGKYRSLVISKYVNMDIQDFNRYNPKFDKLMDEDQNTYDLKLPQENMEKFIANKYPILNESVQLLLSEPGTVTNELNKKQQTTAIK